MTGASNLSRDATPSECGITEASLVIIKALREQIPDLQPSSPLHIRFDDAYLNRFVIARKYQLDEVLIMVLNHLEWFKNLHVADIMNFRYTELEQFRTVYPHGYHGVDKLGRPLYIERYCKLNADYLHQITTLERISQYWIQGYEKLMYERFPLCPTSGSKSCVILDMANVKLGMFDSRAREFMKTVSKISSDNYPETLGILFVVNVPSFFSVLYSVAKPLIPAETKKKIHVVNAKHVKEELLKYIDADQLPFFLGGNCKCNLLPLSGDFGCLCSDKGPWKQNRRGSADHEDFVSCHDGEMTDLRSFKTAEFGEGTSPHHAHGLSETIDEELDPNTVKNRTKSKRRFGWFACCARPDTH